MNVIEDLKKEIEKLKKSDIAELVKKRLVEFKDFKTKPSEEWFSELCFCILTANSSAALGIKIQNAIGARGFLSMPQKELEKRLKELGHRFYNIRAEFIVRARKYKNIKNIISGFDGKKARAWLVKNIKGIGMKEASHFLRNVGYTDVSIIDRHILSILRKHELIPQQAMTPKRYEEIEKLLEEISRETQTNLAELDLYLWYMKTGNILK
ncbi:MAG: N-glycosylase/DNA lyase [Candidatus Aenigmarchaeota archaeon]|nr:N-glycosylase/DNA lyase [Candidatus Aenigmarchaeota archaeon]